MNQAAQQEVGPGFEPEVVVLYCENCTGKGVDLAGARRRVGPGKARFAVLPCTSKIEIAYLVKIFESGADAVQVVGCSPGACRFMTGTPKAEARVNLVRELLEEIGFGRERLAMHREMGCTTDMLIELAGERARVAAELGPNPMKGES